MSAAPDAFSESIESTDVIVVADELQLADVGHALEQTHRVALIVLTNNDERVLPLLRSLELRGWGLVPPDTPASQLQAAVIAASQGLATFPATATHWLYENPPILEALSLEEIEEPLTPREREVLELVSQGLPNKLIARKLTISEHTVKFHLSSLSAKLGASSRTDAVRRGLRYGLITL
jgi:DNA-binding NarL/FixJ family response regulator